MTHPQSGASAMSGNKNPKNWTGEFWGPDGVLENFSKNITNVGKLSAYYSALGHARVRARLPIPRKDRLFWVRQKIICSFWVLVYFLISRPKSADEHLVIATIWWRLKLRHFSEYHLTKALWCDHVSFETEVLIYALWYQIEVHRGRSISARIDKEHICFLLWNSNEIPTDLDAIEATKRVIQVGQLCRVLRALGRTTLARDLAKKHGLHDQLLKAGAEAAEA